jgi:hypothetical protein
VNAINANTKLYSKKIISTMPSGIRTTLIKERTNETIFAVFYSNFIARAP